MVWKIGELVLVKICDFDLGNVIPFLSEEYDSMHLITYLI